MGFFSPFPHGTGPLSVIREYLGLSGGPDRFTRDFSGPVLLGILIKGGAQHYGYGAHTLYGRPFKTVHLYQHSHLPGPAEPGQQVPQPRPCNARRLSHMSRFSLIRVRTPWDHSPVIDSPRLIADSYVLLRLLMPRHPPCALKNLTTKDQKVHSRENHRNQPHTTTPKGHHHARPDPGSYSWKLLLIKDARVHYVVLKQQPRTTHPTHTRKKGQTV